MHTSLYKETHNDRSENCPLRHTSNDQWSRHLPPALKDLVVTPVSFQVSRDYEIQAEHTHGRDISNQPCFSQFQFVLTGLHCDDDEIFYEIPVYTESLTSWRLLDERWLVFRSSVSHNDHHADQMLEETSLLLSDTMPR